MTDPAPNLSAFQQEILLRVYRPPQLFAVVSWGCAATSWLATVLNAHPRIFCVHASNWFWKTFGGSPNVDGVQYLRLVGSQGHSYAAAGDVHGVSRERVPELRSTFGDQFNAVVVVRQPMRRLASQMALFERLKAFETWDVAYVDWLIEQKRLVLPSPLNYGKKLFVHGVSMLNSILVERSVGKIYRAEDLTSRAESLGDLVCELTRERVVPDTDWLNNVMQTQKVNPHAINGSGAELAEWQLEVLRRVVTPQTWDAYAELGYEPPSFLA